MRSGQRFNPRARDGRDLLGNRKHKQYLSFNPRARDGRDPAEIQDTIKTAVSIHAPVMDAILN